MNNDNLLNKLPVVKVSAIVNMLLPIIVFESFKTLVLVETPDTKFALVIFPMLQQMYHVLIQYVVAIEVSAVPVIIVDATCEFPTEPSGAFTVCLACPR